MDANSQLPGGVEFGEQEQSLEEIRLAAFEQDLGEHEEAHGTDTGDGEELEFSMSSPPRHHGGAVRYLSIPILEELQRLGADMDQDMARHRWFQEAANGCGSRVPASPAFVASLETHKYGGACAVPDGGASMCVICKEDFEVGDDLIVLPCRHRFHRSCLAKWSARSRLCPLCRHALPAAGTTNDTAQAPN